MAIAIKGRADFPSQAAAPPALPKGEPSCAMTNLEASRIRRGAGTSLAVPPSRVIPRSEASLALPLGELSPKVTERALQALPISSGRCSNGTHLRLVIARSEASLALPLGELSPKVTERALQALLNGNSNQGEGCFSLSGGCAASSPKGRAKLRNDRSGNLPHPGFYSRELIFDVISRILSCRPLEEFGSSCSTFFRA